MARYSKPETADRVTINKESIVSPNQPLVSNQAKNNMKDNYQKEKQKVDSSKPSSSDLKVEIVSNFESDSNHTEYKEELNAQDISLSGDTFSARDLQDDDVQIISQPTNIYDNVDINQNEGIVVGDIKTSDKYGDYAIIGDSSNKNTIYQESKFEVPKGLKLNIIPHPFHFFQKTKTNINQIILHHTVSDPRAGSEIINIWNKQSDGVATHFVLKNDGTVFQAYDLDNWAYHIGCRDNRNVKLNKGSVGIEISNWGGLTKTNGKLYNAYKKEVPDRGDIIYFKDGFRGYYYFQRYTKEQIGALRELILYIASKYNIPLSYNKDMWDYSENAMNGKPGIWNHVSYRKDKSDCFPQDDLIGMLKGLK